MILDTVSQDVRIGLRILFKEKGFCLLAVLVLASVSAYRQFNENEARTTPHANEYAIADSAIQTEFSQ